MVHDHVFIQVCVLFPTVRQLIYSPRFPLCLVYRIFDIVFAEGVEAIFRFSMALMRKNEDRLLKLDFEGVLKFMSDKIFECYKVCPMSYHAYQLTFFDFPGVRRNGRSVGRHSMVDKRVRLRCICGSNVSLSVLPPYNLHLIRCIALPSYLTRLLANGKGSSKCKMPMH